MCRIITDHKTKQYKYLYELPAKIRKEYEESEEYDGFILYRKRWYILSDFMRVDERNPFAALGYHGYLSDSFFSGVLIKLIDSDSYQIATYIS